jgi:hypothetical protein
LSLLFRFPAFFFCSSFKLVEEVYIYSLYIALFRKDTMH